MDQPYALPVVNQATDNPFTLDLSFIDFETTGLPPDFCEPISVGLVRVKQPSFEVVTEFEVKLRFKHPERFSPKAREVNGYTEEAWKDALPLGEGMRTLLDLMEGSIPVAYKIDFDSPFLFHAMKRSGLLAPEASAPWYYALCAMTRSYTDLYVELEKLRSKNVMEYLGLPPEPEPHSALGGARQARDIWVGLHRRRYIFASR